MPMPRITYSITLRRASRLGQNPREFFAIDENIVGPLDRRRLRDNEAPTVSAKATAAIKVICGACLGGNLGRRIIDK